MKVIKKSESTQKANKFEVEDAINQVFLEKLWNTYTLV